MFSVFFTSFVCGREREREKRFRHLQIITVKQKVGHFQRTFSTNTHNSRLLKAAIAIASNARREMLRRFPRENLLVNKRRKKTIVIIEAQRDIAISLNYNAFGRGTWIEQYFVCVFFSSLRLSEWLKIVMKSNQQPRCQVWKVKFLMISNWDAHEAQAAV